MQMDRRRLVPLLALALWGCPGPLYPGPDGDYDGRFAASWYEAERRGEAAVPLEQLTVEQLWAVHRYGLNRMHPSRGMSGEFARRGAAAVPFLRAMLERQRSYGEVGSILEALRAMQDRGTVDPRTDLGLIALIQRSARAYDDPYAHVRDIADEIETGTRIPNWFQPYYRDPRLGGFAREGRGDDYDVGFARRHCRRCSYRQWTAGLDQRPIEQLYALQRYAAENLIRQYNIDHIVARRGAAAIPFYKEKLRGPGTDIMVWNILSTLEAMRDLGTYDVAGDSELMALAAAAAQRVDPDPGPLSHLVARLKTGDRLRTFPARPMG
jgi:hypothetical protein